MHIFPKAIVAGFAVLFLMGVEQCPSQPSVTEEVVEDGNPRCGGCIKDVTDCVSALLHNGAPVDHDCLNITLHGSESFCGALNKCENRLKCDICVTVNDEPYIRWRKYALDRRVCSQ